MSRFILENSLFISALILVLAIILFWKTSGSQFQFKLPEIFVQAAIAFLAIAFAFEQSDFDRSQQRREDAKTIARGAMATIPVIVGQFVSDQQSWPFRGYDFSVPTTLDKFTTDERILATLSIPDAKKLTEDMNDLRSIDRLLKDLVKNYNEPSMLPDYNKYYLAKSSSLCEYHRLSSMAIARLSRILQLACKVAKDSELKNFTSISTPGIAPRNSVQIRLLEISNCTISTTDTDIPDMSPTTADDSLSRTELDPPKLFSFYSPNHRLLREQLRNALIEERPSCEKFQPAFLALLKKF